MGAILASVSARLIRLSGDGIDPIARDLKRCSKIVPPSRGVASRSVTARWRCCRKGFLPLPVTYSVRWSGCAAGVRGRPVGHERGKARRGA